MELDRRAFIISSSSSVLVLQLMKSSSADAHVPEEIFSNYYSSTQQFKPSSIHNSNIRDVSGVGEFSSSNQNSSSGILAPIAFDLLACGASAYGLKVSTGMVLTGVGSPLGVTIGLLSGILGSIACPINLASNFMNAQSAQGLRNATTFVDVGGLTFGVIAGVAGQNENVLDYAKIGSGVFSAVSGYGSMINPSGLPDIFFGYHDLLSGTYNIFDGGDGIVNGNNYEASFNLELNFANDFYQSGSNSFEGGNNFDAGYNFDLGLEFESGFDSGGNDQFESDFGLDLNFDLNPPGMGEIAY